MTVQFCLTGRDGKVVVFRLTDFEGANNDEIVRGRTDCRDHKLEKTKGNLK